MKREARSFMLLAGAVLPLFCLRNGLAQTNPTPTKEREEFGIDPAGDSPSPSHDSREPADKSARRLGGGSSARRQVARIRKLHQAMIRKLSLAQDQLAALESLVEEFTRTAGRPGAGESARPDRSELKKIRRKMIEAKKRGDRKTAETLRRQWLERAVQVPRVRDSTATIIKRMEDVLEDAQRPVFRRLLQRLHLDDGSTQQTGAFGAILRASRHRSLQLTDEQRAAVRQIVREEILAIPKERRDSKMMNDAAPVIRQRILSELTAVQRAQFQALLDGKATDGAVKKEKPTTEDDRTASPKKNAGPPESSSESKKPGTD